MKECVAIKEAIQVCSDISDIKAKKREIRPLLRAMSEFKLKKGLVITEDFENKEQISGKRIIYKPLWLWLLEKP